MRALVVGRSGMGKSTVSFRLTERGYRVVSDDTVFLDQREDDVWAYGVATGLGLLEDVVERYASGLLSRVVWETNKKRYFRLERAEGGPVRSVVFLDRGTVKGETAVKELSETDSVKRLINSRTTLPGPHLEGALTLDRLLARQADCFVVAFDDECDIGMVSKVLSLPLQGLHA